MHDSEEVPLAESIGADFESTMLQRSGMGAALECEGTTRASACLD